MTRMPPSSRMQPAFQIFPELPGAPPGARRRAWVARLTRKRQTILAQGWASKCVLAGPAPRRRFLGELADAAQALQYFAERLLGLVLVKNEEYLFETRVTALHVVDHRRDHRVGRLRGRDPADSAAQGWKSQGGQLVLLGDGQGGPGRGGDLFGIGLEVFAHGDRMDDVRCGQVPRHREHSFADLDRPLSQRVFLDDDPPLALP